MKNKTVRDAMLPLGDVFMIDADSAMDKSTMSKVAYIIMLVFVHLYVTLYLSQKIIPSCFFPLLVKCFTLRPLFDIYTLFLRINQGFIVPLSFAKHF